LVHGPLVVLNGLRAGGRLRRLHRFVSHAGWTGYYASTIARIKTAVIAVSRHIRLQLPGLPGLPLAEDPPRLMSPSCLPWSYRNEATRG
jgi:hypothetical protein